MKVKTDCHNISGTATEIVTELGKFIIARDKTVEEYMDQTLKRMNGARQLQGNNLEERCKYFLQELERLGVLQILK